MSEKTVNAYQRFILLRSRFIAIALCFALLLCSFALPASAVSLNYEDYITSVQVDGDNDIVTVSFPVDSGYFLLSGTSGEELKFSYQSMTYDYLADTTYILTLYPLYPYDLLLSNIPDDTLFNISFEASSVGAGYYDAGQLDVKAYMHYYGPTPFTQSLDPGSFADLQDGEYLFRLQKPAGSTSGSFSIVFNPLRWCDAGTKTITFKSFTMQMTISSLYRLQQETGKTNQILKEVEKQLADQGKTLDEVLQQQQQTNDKLDGIQGGINDTNDKLETLPGQIGDEMQGVIDNEKEESKSEGNKFVDQILNALPDPSTDVLAALKGLTDATAYTGTDAVLPIPAIVLPGIDGLFPETEIWGGTQFDFGEYFGMLPPALLTLVQSLFTIAIVLFCVYELKGIVSYCLTLRENKGG